MGPAILRPGDGIDREPRFTVDLARRESSVGDGFSVQMRLVGVTAYGGDGGRCLTSGEAPSCVVEPHQSTRLFRGEADLGAEPGP